MKLIQVKQTGGAEQLQYVDGPKPSAGPKQALVKIAAAGVNFIDVYHRIGLYKLDLPFTPGMEAAGTVEAVGPDVTGIQPGDRVAYAMNRGSYAEYAVVPAAMLVKLPDHVSFEMAAVRHAARHDGALPDALYFPAEIRRHVSDPRRRGRSRTAGGANGQNVGGARHRHCW